MLKVSVCVVTYNHEKYIADCLQSIIDQKVNFDFEIIVGDDCSSDATRKIVRDFEYRYPQLIKTIFHEKNVGPTANYLAVHRLAKGKYVAHLDGDDCALAGKLQEQYDALELNTDLYILWHRVYLIDLNGVRIGEDSLGCVGEGIRIFDVDELLRLGAVATHSSKMYRASGLKVDITEEVIDQYLDVKFLMINNGKAGILSSFLGNYRVNVGVSSAGRKTFNLLVGNINRLYLEHPEKRRPLSIRIIGLFFSMIKHREFNFILIALFVRSFSIESMRTFWRLRAINKDNFRKIC